MPALAILNPLVDLVFPPRCPLCGDPLAAQGGLCIECWSKLAIPGEPSCIRCQRPMGDDSAEGLTCAPCLARPPRHDGIAAATLYTEASRDLVLAFKHGRRIGLARLLGRLIAAKLAGLEGGWLVVPVPLHRWRLWRRGFNQAALLAQALAKLSGAGVDPGALTRVRATPPSIGMGRAALAANVRGAFRNVHKTRVKGRDIILVDDVLTTGATADACARHLNRAGARRVHVLTFARVVREVS